MEMKVPKEAGQKNSRGVFNDRERDQPRVRWSQKDVVGKNHFYLSGAPPVGRGLNGKFITYPCFTRATPEIMETKCLLSPPPQVARRQILRLDFPYSKFSHRGVEIPAMDRELFY